MTGPHAVNACGRTLRPTTANNAPDKPNRFRLPFSTSISDRQRHTDTPRSRSAGVRARIFGHRLQASRIPVFEFPQPVDEIAVLARQSVAQRHDAARECGGGRAEQFTRTERREVEPQTALKTIVLRDEEIFGPVLAVFPFDTEAEVITRHNAMPYGLSSSVFTSDARRAERIARALETGCINVNNVMLTEGNAGLPFGGVKYSGFGRMKGVEGLRGMTRSKAVLTDRTQGKLEAHWYPYSTSKLSLTQELLRALGRRGVARYVKLAKAGMANDALIRKMPKD